MARHWKEIAAEKKQQRDAIIPKEWLLTNLPPPEILNVIDFPNKSDLLAERDIEITNSEVGPLLDKLAKGTWTAVEVTTAFSKRAIIAHQLVNCLTEVFIDRALARAAELDDHLRKTGKVVGPLHGLPISLKDQISIKGLESTMGQSLEIFDMLQPFLAGLFPPGYVSWIGQYAEKNSVLVDILEAAGAVLYVKTNIPQTLMWPETFNHIFGRTSNPYNRSLTSGGSSGGEGALIALRGSPIGVGSDIGGSIRIPAAFNGLYGLRPSYGRIPYAGCVNSLEGLASILSVLGPLCRNIDGIKSFMKAVIDQEPWLKDPMAVRKPWSEDEYRLVGHGQGQNLCFAILWDDGVTKPHPPIIRALGETQQALLTAGHRVIDWTPLKHEEIYRTGGKIWTAGAAEDFRVVAATSGEPVIGTMEEASEATDTTSNDAPVFRPMPGGLSAYELWQEQKRRRGLREEYLDHWNATKDLTGTGRPVDAIISPCAPFVAPPHGKNSNASYTMVWNVLDYTALVVPVGFVNPTQDGKLAVEEFYSEQDKANYDLYDPETFKDTPISIQVVGRTLEEEAVIRLGEIVDQSLKTQNK